MKTFLFDLDGTLLPMDQEVFIKKYFSEIAKVCAPLGYEAKALMNTIWEGTLSMISNDGTTTNRQRFWDTFARLFGEHARKSEKHFDKFYENEFNNVKVTTSPTPLAGECVRILKEKGYRLILATNPIFPKAATLSRVRWAGLNPEDFELITTYENSTYCKPSLDYYKEILEKSNVQASECIMVGNDVKEDMCVSQLGMDTFLLKDYIINEKQEDISKYRQGFMKDLYEFLDDLPSL